MPYRVGVPFPIEPGNFRKVSDANHRQISHHEIIGKREEQTAVYETPHLRSSNRTGKESETLPWLQKPSFRLRGGSGNGNNLEDVIYTQKLEKMIVDKPTARLDSTTAFRLVETLAALAAKKEKTGADV
ncbi:Uncharacterized protein Fot_09227 [Forsythia ovata]|uniref:Uncharacterized protein n=1 Tax=Forsythia ovata TaxID=205694 RepID=A0ABD1WDQ3_9LAMI